MNTENSENLENNEETPGLPEETAPAAAPAPKKDIWRQWIIPFGLEILVLFLILRFGINSTYVPSGSMWPTIEEHSVLLCPRIYNPEKALQRGDIVSFWSDEHDERMIKRLIGLPGERVDIDPMGNVYIDGEPLEEPYVINQQEGEPYFFVVPENCYFFLGDNRSGSLDARYWEEPYIPADKIINEAKFTLWPPKNFGFLH